MITEQLLHEGYVSGIVRVVNSPNDGEAVCQIGDSWFYFWNGGEALSAEEMKARYPAETIVHAIWEGLEACRRELEFTVEYSYYESILREQYRPS